MFWVASHAGVFRGARISSLRAPLKTPAWEAMGAIHSTKIPTGPTGKNGPPQKVDPFFRNFSGWTELIHWVLDRNFRKFWLNGSRPMFWGVLLKASPRPRARDSPVAQRPSPDFPQFFCPAVNPRACTDLHRVWACKMDDGEFEFVYHFNNHLNPIRPFLSLHVAKWKTLSFSVYSSVYRTR